MKSAVRAALFTLVTSAAVAAPTIEDVGDVDSFGRAVKYLGVTSSSYLYLQTDCTPDPEYPFEAGARCLTVSAPPATLAINETGLATLKLPGGAARSLLCFTFQQIGYVYYSNETQSNQSALLSMRSVVTLQSDVLNNPQLINPETNAPYNGKLDVSIGLISKSKVLPAGYWEQEQLYGGRTCIGGLISKRVLVDQYGLSSLQASSFFARPITLTFGLAGSVRSVDAATLAYGVRLYGD
jgi:hypothetical protein